MKSFSTALVAATLLLSACGSDNSSDGDKAGAPAGAAAVDEGATIAAGLDKNSQFAKAIEAAGLTPTLEGVGPYTVLAPNDAAFDKLPAGALDTLMKSEGKAELAHLLSLHILPGTMLAGDIKKAIEAGGGKATLPTMADEPLTATLEGGQVVLTDQAGTKAIVTAADGKRGNGIVHGVDSVLMTSK